MSRIWRDGQTKPVYIYRLISKDVIEDSVLMRQRSKSLLACVMSEEDGEDAPALMHDKRMSLTNTDIVNLIQPKFPLDLAMNDKVANQDQLICDDEEISTKKYSIFRSEESNTDFTRERNIQLTNEIDPVVSLLASCIDKVMNLSIIFMCS